MADGNKAGKQERTWPAEMVSLQNKTPTSRDEKSTRNNKNANMTWISTL